MICQITRYHDGYCRTQFDGYFGCDKVPRRLIEVDNFTDHVGNLLSWKLSELRE